MQARAIIEEFDNGITLKDLEMERYTVVYDREKEAALGKFLWDNISEEMNNTGKNIVEITIQIKTKDE